MAEVTAAKGIEARSVSDVTDGDAVARGRVLWLVSALESVGREFKDRYFWHRTRDRYVLFLAEFFLRRSNRTTVERFLPGFIERFPDADSLADASPDEVVATTAWAGLRKRTVHLPYIVSKLKERERWSAAELRTLPHIGAYGADGIALYVFGEATFPLDNNVRRVVGRSLGITADTSLNDVVGSITGVALSDGGLERLRYVHMGTLALGWDHCRKTPDCTGCPLSSVCAYRAAANPID